MKRTAYNLENHAHFLTFTCYKRQHLLRSDYVRRQLLRFWDDAKTKINSRILAYVIMTNHVHLLVWPNTKNYDIGSILRQLKEPFSRWLINYLQTNDPLTLRNCELIKGPRIIRRVWQSGGGFDRSIVDLETLRNAINYTEWNPVRKGFVSTPEDWRWSSAYARHSNREIALNVDSVHGLV